MFGRIEFMDSCKIVTPQDWWFIKWIPSSLNKKVNQISSVLAFARHQNSASVLDLETVCCFFEPHVIKFPPKKTHKLEVECLSSGSDAQPASAKAWTEKLEGCLRIKPNRDVSFRYRRILLTSCQWDNCCILECSNNASIQMRIFKIFTSSGW